MPLPSLLKLVSHIRYFLVNFLQSKYNGQSFIALYLFGPITVLHMYGAKCSKCAVTQTILETKAPLNSGDGLYIQYTTVDSPLVLVQLKQPMLGYCHAVMKTFLISHT